MANNPQREINARSGRAGSRLASPGTGGLGGVATGSGALGASGVGSGAGLGGGPAGPGGAGPLPGEGLTIRGFFSVFRHSRRAIELVWSTNPVLSISLGLLTMVAGVLPATVPYVGALIVDAVVAAIRAGGTDP